MSLSNFNIQSRLARTVTTIWLLVMSVIVVCYITNYNSMLNAQKVNVNEILANDAAIGYLKHHFNQSYLDWYKNLKTYTTEEECAQALSQGPNRGGVGVILMDRLDALHFLSRRPGYTYCDISSDADTPRSLGVKDFLVWFIITLAASTLALIKFFLNLLYRSGTHPQTVLLEVVPPNGLRENTDLSETVPQNDLQEIGLVRRLVPGTHPQTVSLEVVPLNGLRENTDPLEMVPQNGLRENADPLETVPQNDLQEITLVRRLVPGEHRSMERQYSCRSCSGVFQSSQALGSHVRIHIRKQVKENVRRM